MASHVVDLTKVSGKGEISCPKCGTKISPDDETEEVFTILEPIMKGESLERLVIQCNKCETRIVLRGFRLLNKIK